MTAGAAALQGPGVALRSDDLIALRQVAIMSDAAPVLAALPGGFPTRRKGHGLEVADMREYVAGDDLRHLASSATARTGRLHIRQFSEERDRITLLVADFRPNMLWGLKRAFRSVAAAEVLALIGWHVVFHQNIGDLVRNGDIKQVTHRKIDRDRYGQAFLAPLFPTTWRLAQYPHG